ncbi:MAG: IscS subfamily cysteine desulfurase [Candidatus Omnitrophica bacterium]|nr:IscS subfamily cysteine desulfurase [Candidatus Omnitrophota bacterium]
MKLPIYMDCNATTPVDPRVLEKMLPYFKEVFGNAASKNHPFGRAAEEAVETARKKIARAVHVSEECEVIFTSGATESNNLAIQGVARQFQDRGKHIITCVIEHKSVLDTCRYLETGGFQVTYLPVDREGVIDLQQLESAITDKTILISIMHANNEIGVVQPVAEIGRMAKKKGVFFHCDAVQSIGKIPVDMQALSVDLLSLSAHKLYGPKGIGALCVRKRNPRVRLTPLIYGGGHEQGLRSGTLNVPAIVGFGEAIEIAMREMVEESKRIFLFRESLRTQIVTALERVYVNGSLKHRLPGNLNLSFPFVEGESLLMELSEKVAVSTGSACTQLSMEPSYVLKALGIGENLVHTSIRFGLGRFTTEEEVNFVANYVVTIVKRLRELSPIYQVARVEKTRAAV